MAEVTLTTSNSTAKILHTVDHLFAGYFRENSFNNNPLVIYNLIWIFFAGDRFKRARFDIIFSSSLHQRDQLQFHDTILNILCPGPSEYDHIASWLKPLIKSNFSHIPHASALVVSLLMDICDFYSALDHEYNVLLTKQLWLFTKYVKDKHKVDMIRTITKLLKQNDAYHNVYRDRELTQTLFTQEKNQKITEDRLECTTNIPITAIKQFAMTGEIEDVRRLFVALLLYEVDDYTAQNTQQLISSMVNDNTFVLVTTGITIHDRFKWIWLLRETQFFVSNRQGVSSDSYFHALLDRLLDMFVDWSKNHTINSRVWDRAHCTLSMCTACALDIVCLLRVKGHAKISEGLNPFNKYQIELFVAELLRSNKYGIAAWRLMQIEMRSENHVKSSALLSFMENKTGLIQTNIVKYVKILNRKVEGNAQYAQEILEIASSVCYQIHELATALPKFNRFYKKLKVTKCIKPIIQKLKINDS